MIRARASIPSLLVRGDSPTKIFLPILRTSPPSIFAGSSIRFIERCCAKKASIASLSLRLDATPIDVKIATSSKTIIGSSTKTLSGSSLLSSNATTLTPQRSNIARYSACCVFALSNEIGSLCKNVNSQFCNRGDGRWVNAISMKFPFNVKIKGENHNIVCIFLLNRSDKKILISYFKNILLIISNFRG